LQGILLFGLTGKCFTVIFKQLNSSLKNDNKQAKMKTAATIAIFCAGGGLTRYYLSGWVYSLLGRAFPYGTFVVNVIGAYFIGLIMELGLRSTLIPDTLRLGLTVGFLGGLTTFSTFSYETFTLLEDGQFLLAFANVMASVLICLIFTWLGIITIRTIS
jgi:CrcB protein